MTSEPENLILTILREMRSRIDERFDQIESRIDRLDTELAELRAEVREGRTALNGLSYLVNLQTGDHRAALGEVNARLDRLERQRA